LDEFVFFSLPLLLGALFFFSLPLLLEALFFFSPSLLLEDLLSPTWPPSSLDLPDSPLSFLLLADLDFDFFIFFSLSLEIMGSLIFSRVATEGDGAEVGSSVGCWTPRRSLSLLFDEADGDEGDLLLFFFLSDFFKEVDLLELLLESFLRRRR
jgi:hypothetical protein